MKKQRAQELAEKFLSGDRKSLARLITLVENQTENIEVALAKIYPHTNNAQLIGVTGPPGAGKSTMVDKLIRAARQKSLKVGVLCIDPSSPFSGGAILGDRIRMQNHTSDPDVFIRSIATRGGQGGLSRSTQEVAMLLDAAGFDLVILETAGVGQTELGILGVAHTTMVVLVPESGDDIQMMKAGILEIADLLVVNKCDRQGSDHIVKEIQSMLEINPKNISWPIPVLKTIAEANEGIDKVFEQLRNHMSFLKDSGKLKQKQKLFAKTAVLNVVRDMAAQNAGNFFQNNSGEKLLEKVANRSLDPFTAANKIFS